MKHIFPEECPETDCHLKTCLAKTCEICGNRKKIDRDWRSNVILSSLLLDGMVMFFGLTLGMNTTLDGRFREGTSLEANLAFFASTGLLVMGIVSIILTYTYKKAKKESAVDKCCLASCPANLQLRSCTRCGHPPNLKPFFFVYFALFTAIPTIFLGVFLLCTWGNPVRFGFFIFCCLVSATALLIGLVAWILKR